jgi:CTP synthase (UTP-ammonia lyase)
MPSSLSRSGAPGECPESCKSPWPTDSMMVGRMNSAANTARIAIVGDFNPEYETHHAIDASLVHAAEALGIRMDSKWVATACAARDADRILRNYDGLFIASGSPYRSMEGAFAAIRFARTQRWPLIGT